MAPNLNSTADPAMDSGTLHTARYIRFGPFHIDQQRQQVYREGSRLRLQGKVFQVLIVLIQKQGEVVSREELRQALWPADTHVNYDANVNTTVNKLRQALSESTEKPLYIETIPRKGYSFIGTAEFSDVPFPPAIQNHRSSGTQTGTGLPPNGDAGSHEKRRISILILVLILAGILIGAGAATYWISHFAPQLKHSARHQASVSTSRL